MEETRRAVDRLASALRGSRGLRAQLEQVECPARSAAGKAGWEAKGSAAPLPFVCAAQLAEITAAVALCRSRRRFPVERVGWPQWIQRAEWTALRTAASCSGLSGLWRSYCAKPAARRRRGGGDYLGGA